MGDIQAGSVSFVIAADPREFDTSLRSAEDRAKATSAIIDRSMTTASNAVNKLGRAAGLCDAEIVKLENRAKEGAGQAALSRALDNAAKYAGFTSAEIRKLEDSLGLMTRTAENMSKGTVAAFSLVERAARNYSGVLAQLEGQAKTAGETRSMVSALGAVAESADATAVQIFQLAGRMDGLSGTFGAFHGLTTGAKTELAELATALGLTAAEVGRAEAAMGEAARNQALTDSLKRIGAQAGWTTEQLEIYARQLGIVKAAEAEAAAAPVRRAGAETTLGPKQQAPFNLGLDTYGGTSAETAMNRADAKAWLESAAAAKTAGAQTQAALVSIMAAEAETSRGALALEASISQMVGASTAKLEQLGAAFNLPKEQIESLQAQAAKNIELGIKTDLFKQLAQDANLSKAQIAELETQLGIKLPAAIQKSSSHFKEVGDIMKNVFLYGSMYQFIGAIQSIPGEVVKIEGQMEQLHKTFQGIFGEAKGEDQFAYVEATADKYGKSIDAVASSYRKFAATTDYVGVSSEQTKHIFESVTQAITKVGGSSQDVQGTLRSLEQMLSTNTVTAVEFRREFAMRIPGAMKMGGDAMGVTAERFKELVKSGQVVATDFLPKLAEQLDKFSHGWEVASDTVEANSERFHNAIMKALDSKGAQSLINESLKALTSLTDGFGSAASKIGTALRVGQLSKQGALSDSQVYGGLDKNEMRAFIDNADEQTSTLEGKIAFFKSRLADAKSRSADESLPLKDRQNAEQITNLNTTLAPLLDVQKWNDDTEAAKKQLTALMEAARTSGADGKQGLMVIDDEILQLAKRLEALTGQQWNVGVQVHVERSALDSAIAAINTVYNTTAAGKADTLGSTIEGLQKNAQEAAKGLARAQATLADPNSDNRDRVGATKRIADAQEAVRKSKVALDEETEKLRAERVKATEAKLRTDNPEYFLPSVASTGSLSDKQKDHYAELQKNLVKGDYWHNIYSANPIDQENAKRVKDKAQLDYDTQVQRDVESANKKGQHSALQANAAEGFMKKLRDDSEALKASLDSDEIGKKLAEINKKYDETITKITASNIKGQAMDGAKTLAESNRNVAKELVFGNELDKIFPEKKQADITSAMENHFDELAAYAKKAGYDVDLLAQSVTVYRKELTQLAADENVKKLTTDFNTYFDKSIDEMNIKTKKGGSEEKATWDGVLKDYIDNSDAMYAARGRAYDKILEKAKQTGNKELEYTTYQKMDEAAKTALDRRSRYEDDFTAYLGDALSLQYGLYKSEYGKQQDLWKDYSTDIIKGLQGLENAFDSTIDSLAGDSALGKMKTWHDYVLEMLTSVRKETMAFLADLAKTTLKDKVLKPLLSSVVGGGSEDSASSAPYGLAGSSKAVQALIPSIQSFALSGLVGGPFGAPSIINAFMRSSPAGGGDTGGALITGGNAGEGLPSGAGLGLAGTNLSLALGSGLSDQVPTPDTLISYFRASAPAGSTVSPTDFISSVNALTSSGVPQSTAMYLVSSGMATGGELPSGSNIFAAPNVSGANSAFSLSGLGTDLGYLGKAKSIYDLANGGGSGIVNSVNNWGLDALGIGTNTGVPLSWTLNATQAANYSTWVAEGADPSAAWLGAAQGGGTAVQGGLGSILGAGAVGGAAGGLAGMVLRPDNSMPSLVGAGVGLGAGIGASALGIGAGGTMAGMLGLSSLGGPIGIAAGLIASTVMAVATPDTVTHNWSQAPGSSPATEIIGGNVAPSAYGVLATTKAGMLGSSDTSHQVVYQAATDPAQIKAQDDAWKKATQSLYDFGNALGQTKSQVQSTVSGFNFPETALPQGMSQDALDKNIATAQAQYSLGQTGQLDEILSLAQAGETLTDELARLSTGMKALDAASIATATDFTGMWSSMDKIQGGNYLTQLADASGGMSEVQNAFNLLTKHGPDISQTNAALATQQIEQKQLAEIAIQANQAMDGLGTSMNTFWADMQTAVSSGTLDPATFDAWKDASKLVDSLQTLQKTLDDTAKSANESAAQLNYSLTARDQQAQGETRAAQVTQMLAAQEKELYDARAQGLSEDVIARIQQVQADEAAALAQQQALQLQQVMTGFADRIAAASSPADQQAQWLSDWQQKRTMDYHADQANYGEDVATMSNRAYDAELKAHLDALSLANQDAQRELDLQTQIDAAKKQNYTWEANALSMLGQQAKAMESAYASGMSSDYISQLQTQQQQEMSDYWVTTTQQLQATAQGITNQYNLDLDTRLGGVNDAFTQLTDDLNLYYEAGGRTAEMQKTIMALAASSASTLRQLAQSLGDTALSLNQQYNPNANPNTYFQAVYGEYTAAVNQGKGGDQTAIARAQSLSSTVLQAAQAQGSYSTFQQTYAQVQSDLSQLQTVATNTASSMDTIYDSVGKDAIADSSAAAAAAKVDAAQSAYNLLKQQAIEAYNNSMEGQIVNALAYTGDGALWQDLTNKYEYTNGKTVDAYLHANPSQVPGYVGWFQNNAGMGGSGVYDQWAAITGLEGRGIDTTGGLYAQVQSAQAALQAIRGYSTGGVIPNGTSGVDNALVFAQKGERILSTKQTASFDRLVAILDSNGSGSSDLVEAVTSLQKEISIFRDENKRGIISVAASNDVISKWINKWERVGLPATRA